MTTLRVHGMHGMGDCIHQRAVIRALVPTYDDLWLETSWPCIFHDLPVKCVRRPVALRTQLKNASREGNKFATPPNLLGRNNGVRIAYNRSLVGDGTVLQAMFKVAGIPDRYAQADFSLPVPALWQESAALREVYAAAGERPICVYRPLTVRPEWRGGQLRNAHAGQYAEVFSAIRDGFFVVSIADLEPHREWIVGPRLKADMAFHQGELPFEQLAALFQRAKLVFSSGGFPVVLAPAVGVPCISILGGYEPASWNRDGAAYAPWLGIDTLKPCTCATAACAATCSKELNVAATRDRVREFVAANCGATLPPEDRPVSEIFDPEEHSATIVVRPHTLNPRLIRGNPLQRGARNGGVSVKA